MSYVEFRDVKKVYKTGEVEINALRDVDFEIEKGEFCVIVGASGAGKTTILNILGGMDTLTSGSVKLDGREISTLNKRQLTAYRRYDVGFVFQFYNLVQNLTALENVELPLLYAGVGKRERRQRAKAALEKVGLAQRMMFKPTQLSGGQKQRVAIARAIVNNPKLLLADEPTGALDTKSGDQVMELFKELNDDGVTIVMITHEPDIARCAKRIMYIRDGELHGEKAGEQE